MSHTGESVKEQSRFDRGIQYAKEYYSEHAVWNVNFDTIYKGFALGQWWTSTRRSITLGSLDDVQVNELNSCGIDFGIVPLDFKQWYEMVQQWLVENNEFPLEKSMHGGYCIGKWFKRNKKYIEQCRTNDEVSLVEFSDAVKEKNKESLSSQEKLWLKRYERFQPVWEEAKKDNLSVLLGYTKTLYLWGLEQSELDLAEWQKKKLDAIGFVWEKDAYESIFSPWLERFYSLRRLIEADEEQLAENFDVANMRIFDWAEEQLLSEIEIWQKKKLKSIGIGSCQELRELASKKKNDFQNATFRKKIKAINNERIKGNEEGIVSIKVIGRQIDYVRNDVVDSSKECDYYEVRIQLCSTFTEKEFREYVEKNKHRFVECGRKEIIEQRNKRKESKKVRLRVDKMVYGLSSHMVTLTFSVWHEKI